MAEVFIGGKHIGKGGKERGDQPLGMGAVEEKRGGGWDRQMETVEERGGREMGGEQGPCKREHRERAQEVILVTKVRPVQMPRCQQSPSRQGGRLFPRLSLQSLELNLRPWTQDLFRSFSMLESFLYS